jgi:hypothetical protein
MNSLTHFSFSLVTTPRMTTATVVVYVSTPSTGQQHNSTIFRTWASSADPLSYGKIVDVGITNRQEVDEWGMAFLKGENDMWPTLETFDSE